MKKNLKFIVLALVILGAVGLWQASVMQTKNKVVESTQEIEKTTNINITFTFTDTDTTTIAYPLVANNTKNLFAVTEEIAKQQIWDLQYKDYGEMGYLVTKINNTENGQGNKYWQYYVNGEQPQISANKYTPQAGEKIEWRYAESAF